MTKTIKAMTIRTWIKPPAWNAKNPKAHRTTRMIKIVSSICISFSLLLLAVLLLADME
jgi:hypothetical protein